MRAYELVAQLGVWSMGPGPLQQKLARGLVDCIRKGVAHPGIRLPSERSLAQALSISRTTVVAAYDALRESGWLESRTGSGTWVCERSQAVAAARGAAHASALASSPLLGLLTHRDDEDIIDFVLGSPLPLPGLPLDLFTLPPEEYAALVHDRLHYPLGLPAAREAVAGYYRKAGLPTRPEEVLITNGAQHAIALCAALYLQRGDSVLVEDPAYFGALDVFRVVGARVSPLPVEAAGVPAGVLRDRMIATAARLVYLTPTFQNPTGAVMPRSARKEVARSASELGIPVIDDGTLSELALDGPTPPPIATYTASAPLLTVGSLSKLTWPGLRAGWVRAPEPIIERLARVKSANDLGSPLLTQAITVRLLGAIDRIRLLRRRELKPRRDLLAALLRESLPDWKFRMPAGGLFLWVKLPAGDSREFAQVALRHGMLFLPGPAMSAAEQHAAFIRLPFLAEEQTLRAGVRRLAAAWRDYQSAGRRARRPNVAMV
ncbi:MAG TPA: PLP-dependent aminotransferase family protein [Bryobacteraceae bacterium]|nr:PLP-dependent aminotransferase family protein [Bryobacteraceae bacterium]